MMATCESMGGVAELQQAVRFGVLGAGAIARRFLRDVMKLPCAQVVAAGARDLARAKALAQEFGIPKAYGGYEELVSDADIDVIYIATPHNFHMEHTLLALRHGKHVLCEKPFSVNYAQGKAMADEARFRNLFLMEAMWTRFFPAMKQAVEWVRQGEIGNVTQMQAQFSSRPAFISDSRLFSADLAGGALLDVGVYLLAFFSAITGEAPVNFSGECAVGQTGVDEQASFSLEYPCGALASAICGLRAGMPHTAAAYGERGHIVMDTPFWKPKCATLYRQGKPELRFEAEHEGEGFQFEVQHVCECIREGRTESPIMTLDETLSTIKTTDALRALWGIRYPFE